MSIDPGAQQFWFNGLPVKSLVGSNVTDANGQKYWFEGAAFGLIQFLFGVDWLIRARRRGRR